MKIDVPLLDDVTPDNQHLFLQLQRTFGFVPKLHATLAHSDTALRSFVDQRLHPTSLDASERAAIGLVVGDVNDCGYMLCMHAAEAVAAGFTEVEIVQLRSGTAPFDTRLGALVRLARNIAVERGFADTDLLDALGEAGYTRANLIDAIMLMGTLTIGAYVANIADMLACCPRIPHSSN